jgi:pimeloyl-ACP methyl ester carboxylesterase
VVAVTQGQDEPFSQTFISQGLKLHYVDWGNEGAPCLLLIHGIRDHARSWDWVARALRGKWRIIAPDLRGHGDSQWSPDGAYLSPYHVLDIVDLIATLGYEKLTIVGHSYGGNIASRFAAIYPARVKKLVLVDGLGPSPEVRAEWNAQGQVKRTRDWIEKRRDSAARKPRRFDTLEEAVARMAAANRHLSVDRARHLAVHGVRHHPDGYGWKYDPDVFNFLPEDFPTDSDAFWREVTTPTLLCWGTESWTANPEKDPRTASFREHRAVVFEKAGHWLHHDQLEAFLSVLNGFL